MCTSRNFLYSDYSVAMLAVQGKGITLGRLCGSANLEKQIQHFSDFRKQKHTKKENTNINYIQYIYI